MSYQALYRKLRPKTFEEIFGQEDTVKTLKNQIKHNMIAHSYLFSGTRGTGKTSLAKVFANAVNCFDEPLNRPCGKCEFCKDVNDNCLDIIELDAASRNGVDDIKSILEQVHYPPQIGKYKVYIIDEVHMLSNSAFNALLKTLEEPPEHIIFIFATTEPQKIPATILSRCQKFELKRISTEILKSKIIEYLQHENISYEDEAISEIAMAAEGSVRDCWSILDVCLSALDEKTTLNQDTVQRMLGISDKQIVISFCDAIINSHSQTIIKLTQNIMDMGKDLNVFIKQLCAKMRLVLFKKLLQNDNINNISEEENTMLKSLSENISIERLLYIIDILMQAEASLKYTSSPRIGFEAAALKASILNNSSFTISTEDIENNIINKLKSENLLVENKQTNRTLAEEKQKTKETIFIPKDSNDILKLLKEKLFSKYSGLKICEDKIKLSHRNNEYILYYDDRQMYANIIQSNFKNIHQELNELLNKNVSFKTLPYNNNIKFEYEQEKKENEKNLAEIGGDLFEIE